MFGVLDSANGSLNGAKPKTLADRACDQCKQRKIRCNNGRPCMMCTAKGLSCSYNVARKKRGPPSKKLPAQHSRQRGSTVSGASTASPFSPVDSDLERTDTAVSLNDSLSISTAPNSFDWHDHGAYQTHENVQSPQGFGEPTSVQSLVTQSNFFSTGSGDIGSPSSFIFPSLPVESPSGPDDPFALIPEQHLPPLPASDIWPANVNETTLLPWIDVYFKRLHPTIPILNRSSLYCDMLLRKHHTDPQYGAMLLGLSAFAMTQPVQIHERASIPSRSVQARMLMEACVKMRVAADFGEDPTIEMVLTSFFLFACLFGSNQHKAARHRLREAVDLAHSLGLHSPDAYAGLESDVREQWLRTYLVLSVTERAYALQQNHPINFRGRPGITARFMHAFGTSTTNEYISSLLYQDQSDAVSMTGLLYLMDTFEAIDEGVMDCWNGFCRFSDGICETFDRRQALQMFRAQRRVREACVSGNISFAPSVTPTPLARLLETQRADITATQYWVLNRLWQLCLTHQLLRETSEHSELRFEFACNIALAMLNALNRLPLAAMEVHGVGFAEKLYDAAAGVVTAVNSSAGMNLETVISTTDDNILSEWQSRETGITVRDLLAKLRGLIRDFRGGDHHYVERLEHSLATVPGFEL